MKDYSWIWDTKQEESFRILKNEYRIQRNYRILMLTRKQY